MLPFILIAALQLAPATASPIARNDAPSTEQREAITKSGSDLARLLELARGWSAANDASAARAAFERVLQLDPRNEEAHLGLGHHAYSGQWFESYAALAKFRRAEDERMLAEKGLVRYRDRWVRPEERGCLELGWAQDASGAWIGPHAAARAVRELELAEKGWQQQDLTWIPPEEFDRWKEGLWKCGDQWLAPAEADGYHSGIDTAWIAPSEHFVVLSTCDREGVEWIKFWADRTWDDLVRIYGVEPGAKPTPLDLAGKERDKPALAVLRSLAQYNELAAGSAEAQRQPVETEGFSSLHYAFYAESWFDRTQTPALYRGAGVAFWDRKDEKLSNYGQHAVRHAAALSFAEAIDPSWNAMAQALQGGITADVFWADKQIPRWLRYGAASYCERYFTDTNVGEGGDPLWARKWALANLKSKGGLRKLDDVFEFELSLDDIEGSTQLIHEAGLVVAFVLEGDDAKVEAAHAAFQKALAKGEGAREAAQKLQDALRKSESSIRRFADGS